MKVRIKQYMYDIIEEGDGDNVYTDKDGAWRIGLCDMVHEKIYIHKDLSYELKKNTLAHELCHAFLFVHGLNGADFGEEVLCNFVAEYHERITEIVDSYFCKER